MNEDYLWDKTGSDPEIEKFENALRLFAHRETAPPVLPAKTAKVVSFPVRPAARVLRYAVAAAACLVLLAVSFGIWMQFAAYDRDDEIVAAVRQDDTDVPKNSAVKSGDEPRINTGKDVSPEAKIIPAAERKIVLPIAHKNIARTKSSRLPAVAVKLTEEEEYAYGQLKLALSITGSKLKLIRDKVDSGPYKDAKNDKDAAVKAVKNGR